MVRFVTTGGELMSDSACCEQRSIGECELDGSTELTAVRAHRQGGREVLVVERAPIPVPAADEVLVAVHVAAITFDELKWPQTWTRSGVSRTPVILSHEVSGVVREVGSEVKDVNAGDDVCGLIGFDRDGAAAEFVAVPAVDLAQKPAGLSHSVAAAVARAWARGY